MEVAAVVASASAASAVFGALAGAGVTRLFRRKELECPDGTACAGDTTNTALVPWEADQANGAQQPSVGQRATSLQPHCQLARSGEQQQHTMWRAIAAASSSSTSAASTSSVRTSTGAVDTCQNAGSSECALGIQAVDCKVLRRAQNAGSSHSHCENRTATYSTQAYQQKCAELGVMKRELDSLRATLQGSCRMLQENSRMQPEEAQRHVNGLVSIGRRLHLKDSLLQMLPMLALKTSNTWSSDDLAVLKSLEAALEAQAQILEERLTQHLAVLVDMRQQLQQASFMAACCRGVGPSRSPKRAMTGSVASLPDASQANSAADCSALHLLPASTTDSEVLQWPNKKRRHDQICSPPALKAIIDADSSMELQTTFVPYWEGEREKQPAYLPDWKEDTFSEKENHRDALPDCMPEVEVQKDKQSAIVKKTSTKTEKIPKHHEKTVVVKKTSAKTVKIPKHLENTAVALLLVIREGAATALDAIKGLKDQDIKRILTARRLEGPPDSLDLLPEVIGRRISIMKLLEDNT